MPCPSPRGVSLVTLVRSVIGCQRPGDPAVAPARRRQLTRHHQPWPDPTTRSGGPRPPPLIPAGQIQLDRFGHALFGSNQQSQGVVISQPAKRKRQLMELSAANCSRFIGRLNCRSRAAVPLCTCCVRVWSAVGRVAAEGVAATEPGLWPADQDQAPGHGSSGRSGRSIGSIVVGTTTATLGHRVFERPSVPDGEPLVGCWLLSVRPVHGKSCRCRIRQTAAHGQSGDQGRTFRLTPDKTADVDRIAVDKVRVWLASQQTHPFGEVALLRRQHEGELRRVRQTLWAVVGQIAEGGRRGNQQDQRGHHAAGDPCQRQRSRRCLRCSSCNTPITTKVRPDAPTNPWKTPRSKRSRRPLCRLQAPSRPENRQTLSHDHAPLIAATG